MGIFYKRETRNFSDEEKEALISMLPGFQGVPTTYTSAKAIENSDVFTAVHMIASDIATLQLEKRVRGVKEPTDSLSKIINERPNGTYNGYQFKFIMVANALLNGESFAEIVRDKKGFVVELIHRANSIVVHKIDKSTNYRLIYFINDGKKQRKVEADDMIHFKFFSLDGVKGVSPLKALKEDIETQQNSKKFLANFFKNGTQNGGLLTFKGGELSKEAREKLKKEWQEANAGSDSAHKVVVLDESMEYEPIKIDTEVLKLINTSNHSTTQVGKVFGIPRHKFGLETSNMNIEEMNMDYLVNTLSPYLESMVSEITFKTTQDILLSDISYKFNTDNYKMIDAETKVKNEKIKIETGISTLNQSKAQFGLPSIGPMGDKHFMNLNLTTLDMLEDYQMSKATNLPIKGGENDEG